MNGEKVCLWPRLGKVDVCGRPCIGEYCGVHLGCLRKGSRGPVVCKRCGVGVKSKIALCMSCGHDRAAHQIAYMKKKHDFHTTNEFRRLAAIDV